MVALVFLLILGRFTANLIILPASLIYMYTMAKISIRKECINAGATATVLLLFQNHLYEEEKLTI